MEYKILKNTDSDMLEEAVNHLINAGWIPLGGVAVTYLTDNTVYVQTMTREVKQIKSIPVNPIGNRH